MYPRLFSPNEQNERMSEWANEQNEQMSKWANISTHLRKWANTFITKWAKWANEQNAQMSKFGVKWAPDVLIYYKNTPGCTMSEF